MGTTQQVVHLQHTHVEKVSRSHTRYQHHSHTKDALYLLRDWEGLEVREGNYSWRFTRCSHLLLGLQGTQHVQVGLWSQTGRGAGGGGGREGGQLEDSATPAAEHTRNCSQKSLLWKRVNSSQHQPSLR